jgi:nitric oxide reductase subunit B
VTCAIVVGALAGDYLGIMGVIDEGWFWIGNQGLSYLELGRLWQILFFAGLVAWSLIMLRTMWPALRALSSAAHSSACSGPNIFSGTAPPASRRSTRSG